jgi:hypothetical protein
VKAVPVEEEYVPVTELVTTNWLAELDVIVAFVRLYALGETPVIVTTSPTEKVFEAVYVVFPDAVTVPLKAVDTPSLFSSVLNEVEERLVMTFAPFRYSYGAAIPDMTTVAPLAKPWLVLVV